MSNKAAAFQNFAERILTGHLVQNRVSSTYLFTGSSAKAKENLALGLALALNCERGSIFEPCDCSSCRKTAGGTHPDVKWIGRDLEARSLKIEEARDLIAGASLKPYEGKYKVFIICEADRLTLEAANALLKTLEEPPPNSVIVLLVENKANLLDTIQSRAFEIRVPAGGETDSGQGLRLMELDEELARGGWEEYWEGVGTKSREEAVRAVDFLLLWLRTKLQGLVSESVASNHLIPNLLEAIDKTTETKSALEANVNQKLALSRLTMWLRKLVPVLR